jgi:hypothetical protein
LGPERTRGRTVVPLSLGSRRVPDSTRLHWLHRPTTAPGRRPAHARRRSCRCAMRAMRPGTPRRQLRRGTAMQRTAPVARRRRITGRRRVTSLAATLSQDGKQPHRPCHRP